MSQGLWPISEAVKQIMAALSEFADCVRATEREKLVDPSQVASAIRQGADQLEREGCQLSPAELRSWASALDGSAVTGDGPEMAKGATDRGPLLHNQIMNLTCAPMYILSDPALRIAYKEGHHDARDAAAELALTGDQCIKALRDALLAMRGESLQPRLDAIRQALDLGDVADGQRIQALAARRSDTIGPAAPCCRQPGGVRLGRW